MTRAAAFMGSNLRELAESCGEVLISQPHSEDHLERSIWHLLRRNKFILRALVEQRFLGASKSIPQRVHDTEAIPSSVVEMYRAPGSMAGAGWHCPAKLLERNKDLGIAFVAWQGRPLAIPLRHVSQHIDCLMAWMFGNSAPQ